MTSIRDQSGYRPPSHTTSYFPSSSSSSSSSSSTVYNTLHGQSTVIDSDTLRAPVLTGTGLRHTHPVSSSNQDPITSYNISIISDGNDNIDDNNNNSNTKSIQSQFNVEKDSTSSQNKKSGTTATATAASRTVTEVLNRHFASSSAVRDFNEAMPVVLPSNFKPSKGIVIDSDPNERLRQYRENADNSP